MDILEAIRTRRTVRNYSLQPVEFEKVMAICEAGALAPSSGNIQSWKFVVIRDRDKIKGPLYEICLEQDCVHKAQVVVMVCTDVDLAKREYGERGEKMYGIQNTAAALQNMLLTAHSLGLGAAWVGAFNEDKAGQLIGIPPNARVDAVLTLGYAKEAPGEKRLRHIDDVVRWENYYSRYKDLHRSLLDFSEEWVIQGKKLKERLGDPDNKIMQQCRVFR